MKYRVKVTLTYEDVVEADNETEAFMLVSDEADWYGDWDYEAEEIKESENGN